MLEQSTEMDKRFVLKFFLDVEICLDNLDRVLVIERYACKLREL